MPARPFVNRLLYLVRDLRPGNLDAPLSRFWRGNVLDIGGWDSYLTARQRRVPHTNWTTLEPDADCTLGIGNERVRSLAFCLLLAVVWLFAIPCTPICLFLSFGDLVEEPNNHLCVARKPTRQGIP